MFSDSLAESKCSGKDNFTCSEAASCIWCPCWYKPNGGYCAPLGSLCVECLSANPGIIQIIFILSLIDNFNLFNSLDEDIPLGIRNNLDITVTVTITFENPDKKKCPTMTRTIRPMRSSSYLGIEGCGDIEATGVLLDGNSCEPYEGEQKFLNVDPLDGGVFVCVKVGV